MNSYSCTTCGRTFTTPAALRQHRTWQRPGQLRCIAPGCAVTTATGQRGTLLRRLPDDRVELRVELRLPEWPGARRLGRPIIADIIYQASDVRFEEQPL